MNILVITFNDSDNLTIENVLYELENRGHNITIFAPFRDMTSIRMFSDLKAAIEPIENLTPERVSQYDIAFSSVMRMTSMKCLDIYCFVYSLYYDEMFMTDGADFLFTYRNGCMPRCSYNCATMQVGDPKNDKVFPKNIKETKRILYIDSGHMPFGHNGKVQIANMILNICREFPEYEICIKPRWLREPGAHFTHRNTEHIYSIIESLCQDNLPSNLNMLEEHLNLQELIEGSTSVITLGSGASLNAILQDKGLLIVYGWDNEDKFDLRNEIELKNKKELFSKSGCVVDIQEVTKYLPYGIRANKAFEDELFCYKSGASEKIVNVMEYVYYNFLAHNAFPAAKEYTYETYRQEMVSDSAITFQTLKQERVRDILQQRVARFSYTITANVDFSKYYNKIESSYKNYQFSEENVSNFLGEFDILKKEILVEQSHLLNDDAIDQSFLLQAFYDTGHYAEILNMEQKDVLCAGPYHYYLGMIYKNEQMVSRALEHFASFLNEANSRAFAKYAQEEWGIRSAYTYIFDKYDGDNISSATFGKLYLAFYKEREMTLVNYKSRKRAHNYIPKVAEQLKQTDITTAIECMMLYAKYEYHYNIREKENALNAALQDNNRLLKSISYRLGRGITFLPRKTCKIVKSIKDEGIKRTGDAIKEDIKNLIEIKLPNLQLIWKTFHTKVMNGYQLYSDFIDKYGSNAYLFLTSASTGDTYIHSMLFETYSKKAYPNSVNVIGVYENSGIDIANLFRIDHAEAYSLDEFRYLWNLSMFAKSESVHIKCMHYHVIYRHIAILMHLEGLHGFNLLSLSEAFLGIEDNAIITPPVFDNNKNILNDMFKKNNLIPGKTVLIAPYAKSVRQIPVSFWKKLVDKLSEQGYKVCTNSIGIQEPAIEGTIAMQIPHSVSVPFLEMAGITIGLRSGFQDITNTANCLKITLYPIKNFNRSIVCDINQSYSIVDMYNPKNQYDMFYSIDTEGTILQNIMDITNEYSEASTEERGLYENSCVYTN